MVIVEKQMITVRKVVKKITDYVNKKRKKYHNWKGKSSNKNKFNFIT